MNAAAEKPPHATAPMDDTLADFAALVDRFCLGQAEMRTRLALAGGTASAALGKAPTACRPVLHAIMFPQDASHGRMQ